MMAAKLGGLTSDSNMEIVPLRRLEDDEGSDCSESYESYDSELESDIEICTCPNCQRGPLGYDQLQDREQDEAMSFAIGLVCLRALALESQNRGRPCHKSKAKSAVDKYQFSCEGYGEARHRSKKVKKVEQDARKNSRKQAGREPSKKWVRKQCKRSSSEPSTYSTPYNYSQNTWVNSDKDILQDGGTNKETTKVNKEAQDELGDKESGDGVTSTSSNTVQPPVNKAEPVAKKPSKKQRLAEQKRREKEMAEIRAQLELQREKEAEKERVRQEQLESSNTRLQDYQKKKSREEDSELQQTLLQSQKALSAQQELTKSTFIDDWPHGSKRKREAKRMRKKNYQSQLKATTLGDVGCNQYVPMASPRSPPRPRSVLKPSKSPELSWDLEQPMVSTFDFEIGNVLKTVQKEGKQSEEIPWPSFSAYSSSTGNEKRYIRGSYPRPTTQRIHPQEPVYKKKDGRTVAYGMSSSGQTTPWSDWGGQKTAESRWSGRASNKAPPVRQQLQPQTTWNTEAQLGFSYGTRVDPAPPPPTNVWRHREDFYLNAVPKTSSEEEQMLQAALEMSRLQEQEDALASKLRREEQEFEFVQRKLQRLPPSSTAPGTSGPSMAGVPKMDANNNQSKMDCLEPISALGDPYTSPRAEMRGQAKVRDPTQVSHSAIGEAETWDSEEEFELAAGTSIAGSRRYKQEDVTVTKLDSMLSSLDLDDKDKSRGVDASVRARGVKVNSADLGVKRLSTEVSGRGDGFRGVGVGIKDQSLGSQGADVGVQDFSAGFKGVGVKGVGLGLSGLDIGFKGVGTRVASKVGSPLAVADKSRRCIGAGADEETRQKASRPISLGLPIPNTPRPLLTEKQDGCVGDGKSSAATNQQRPSFTGQQTSSYRPPEIPALTFKGPNIAKSDLVNSSSGSVVSSPTGGVLGLLPRAEVEKMFAAGDIGQTPPRLSSTDPTNNKPGIPHGFGKKVSLPSKGPQSQSKLAGPAPAAAAAAAAVVSAGGECWEDELEDIPLHPLSLQPNKQMSLTDTASASKLGFSKEAEGGWSQADVLQQSDKCCSEGSSSDGDSTDGSDSDSSGDASDSDSDDSDSDSGSEQDVTHTTPRSGFEKDFKQTSAEQQSRKPQSFPGRPNPVGTVKPTVQSGTVGNPITSSAAAAAAAASSAATVRLPAPAVGSTIPQSSSMASSVTALADLSKFLGYANQFPLPGTAAMPSMGFPYAGMPFLQVGMPTTAAPFEAGVMPSQSDAHPVQTPGATVTPGMPANLMPGSLALLPGLMPMMGMSMPLMMGCSPQLDPQLLQLMMTNTPTLQANQTVLPPSAPSNSAVLPDNQHNTTNRNNASK